MSKKVLSLKKKSSMRKMSILVVIAIFLVFCSVSIFAEEQKTKVDKEKFDKLTPEQKEKFKEMAKEARDTALESVKTFDEVAREAEKGKKTCQVIVKTAIEAEIAAVASVTGPTGAAVGTGAVVAVEKVYNNLTKDKEKK